MDLTTAPTTVIENEAPPPVAQPDKTFAFSNGALRKHSNHHPPPPSSAAVVVSYRECLRNHAARLGGHAVDGCGEFMPSPAANSADPTSLKCAACGCHRNFHRREEDPTTTTTTTYFLDFQRHPPLLPPTIQSSPLSSPSPPPYYSSVPHTLLALSTAAVPEDKPTTTNNLPETPTASKQIGRKRFRTKFSREQKEKMLSFAEKVGWKIQRSDEGLVDDFCYEVGVSKGVLKVWMHNNKHAFAERSETAAAASVDKPIDRNGRILSFDNNCRHSSPTTTTNSHRQSEDNHGVHLSASTSGSPSSSS